VNQPTVNSSSSSSATLLSNLGAGTSSTGQGLTKLQLYQQILIKLNNFKNSKSVQMPSSEQQQLQLTPDEFEQLKKLLELQNQLQTELGLTQTQIATIQTNLINANLISKPVANQTIQIVGGVTEKKTETVSSGIGQTNTTSSMTSSTTTSLGTKVNDWSLAEKCRVLEMIRTELTKLKASLNSDIEIKGDMNQQQVAIRERYMLLMKKHSEIQVD